MNIYSEFVSECQLISPVNGYTCKRITKQNIKLFGFESVSELHKEYPNFPLITDYLKERFSNGAYKANKKRKEKSSKIIECVKNDYDHNPSRCKHCDKVLSFSDRHKKTCSTSCSNRNRKISKSTKEKMSKNRKGGKKPNPYIWCECVICGDKFLSKKTKVSCSSECLKEIRKRNGSIGGKKTSKQNIKRSKDEVLLYNFIQKFFKNVDHNKNIANGWDADILLYDYKIAVLWNGPWHYREMNLSNHSLLQVVNRDIIKVQEFEKIGWRVIIFEDCKWTPEEAFIEIVLATK